MMAKLAGETDSGMLAIVGISVPFRIQPLVQKLDKSIYESYLVEAMKENFVYKIMGWEKEMKELYGIDMEAVAKVKSGKEFDEEFILKMFGFESREEYMD